MNILIAKTARDPSRGRLTSLFYSSAREGMRDLLRQDAAWPGEERVIALPAFIGWSANEGSGVWDPVAELGLVPRFYDLASDLTVDLDSLLSALEPGDVGMVVIIHYFGRVQPNLADIAMMVARSGAVLIEDLAHGLFTSVLGGPAGRNGDVVAYSLHKMLPTPDADGGWLGYRNQSLLTGQQETRGELARVVLDYDWIALAHKRRQNFLVLTELLENAEGLGTRFDLMWPRLREDEAPQTLPVRIREGERDGIYHLMNAEGIGMVSLYHTLIEELSDNDLMVDLSRHIINFPVHQDIDPDLYPKVVDSFLRALNDTGSPQ